MSIDLSQLDQSEALSATLRVPIGVFVVVAAVLLAWLVRRKPPT